MRRADFEDDVLSDTSITYRFISSIGGNFDMLERVIVRNLNI